jgi:6-phosphogluconate dehydrogenase (decarboxylating)
MVPAGAVDKTTADLLPHLERGDILIDGGNSYYIDDIRRAKELTPKGIHYVDVGTSGGVWGLERGYCMMIGGETEVVRHLDAIFAALAPGRGDIPRTPGCETDGGTSEQGYLHCGPSGAGHFVKMVHNGIEYGVMAAYAEGLAVLKAANIGKSAGAVDAETTPLRDPEHYRYDLDLGEITEVWRRGSVIASWLLDLSAAALAHDPALAGFQGRVSDSGEGRWTIKAAIDEGVFRDVCLWPPAPRSDRSPLGGPTRPYCGGGAARLADLFEGRLSWLHQLGGVHGEPATARGQPRPIRCKSPRRASQGQRFAARHRGLRPVRSAHVPAVFRAAWRLPRLSLFGRPATGRWAALPGGPRSGGRW